MGINNNIIKIGVKKYRLDVRVKVSGKKEVRKREVFYGTKNEAEERFVRLRNKLKSRPSASSLTYEIFGDLLNIYHEKKPYISISHKRKCDMLKSDLGGIPIKQFVDEFEDYISYLRRTPSRRGKLRSNATINRLIEIVRAVFNLAEDLEIIEKNPISKARFPKYKEIPRDRYLTKIERQKLIEVIRGNPDIQHIQYIVEFAMQVPSRTGDLINLTRENLDLEKRCIILKNGSTKNDCGCVKPIPPNMVEYFENIPQESDYLFFRRDVKDLNKYHPLGDFKRAWKNAKKHAKLKDLRFHDLRGMAATDLSNNGTDDKILMLIGNWKTRAMLDRYYRKDVDRMITNVRFN